MSTSNHDQLLIALANIAEFASQVGATKEADAFQNLRRKLQSDNASLKDLKDEIFKARGLASFWIPSQISKQRLEAAKKKRLNDTFSDLKQKLDAALLPLKKSRIIETYIPNLAGNKESALVYGDPKNAKAIGKHALQVVQRFSEAVFKGDIETAYGLCANELREWMSVKRFLTELNKADRRFGGKAVACKVEHVGGIYADEPSREQGNSVRNWPKNTPKPNKRATVGTFWFTDREANVGRWAYFWVTEEKEGYRIAKFNQYLQ